MCQMQGLGVTETHQERKKKILAAVEGDTGENGNILGVMEGTMSSKCCPSLCLMFQRLFSLIVTHFGICL